MYDGESPKSEFECHGVAVLHPLYCPGLAPFVFVFFGNFKLAVKGRINGDISTIEEQSSVLCSPNSGEEADIFIKDRALKECPLCRSDTSVETSIYDVIYMHVECSCVR
jgi:hypothetical protein